MYLQHTKTALSMRFLAAWFILLIAGAGAAERPIIVVKDDFESYGDTESMRLFWRGGTGELDTRPPGGGKAVSHNGADLNRHGGFRITPDATHDIILRVDLLRLRDQRR